MACTTCNKNKCTCKETVITKYGKTGRNGKAIRGPQGIPGPPGEGIQGPAGPAGPTGPQGPAGVNTLVVNNTVFVMKNGDDATGLVERLDKPFLTIAAARTAATTAFPTRSNAARINIVVEAGTYSENIILDKYIDYDLRNIVLVGRITDDNVDFGASGEGQWTNIIGGYGSSVKQASASVGALLTFRPNTKLLINGIREISNTGQDTIAVINGIVKIIDCYITCTATASAMYAIEMAQGFGSVDYTYSKLELINCDISQPESAVCPPINFASGGASKNQELILRNCRVKGNSTGAIMVGQATNSNGKLSLCNTILRSESLNSIETIGANLLDVYYYGHNDANVIQQVSANITIRLGTLNVDADVSAGF